jgi:chemotaxis protein CheZ
LQGNKVDNTLHLQSVPHDKDDPVAAVASNMAALLSQISTMETFIKRRFDEISMEINATSQQINMSETGMAKRFGEILNVMNAISYSGDDTTPANTGVGLEAVISETSKAANTILDNCDHLNGMLTPEAFADAQQREKLLRELHEGIQNIMIACSFQDITGQRIRKTIQSMQDIEDRISGALEGIGIGAETLQAAADASKAPLKSGATQADIDELFK